MIAFLWTVCKLGCPLVFHWFHVPVYRPIHIQVPCSCNFCYLRYILHHHIPLVVVLQSFNINPRSQVWVNARSTVCLSGSMCTGVGLTKWRRGITFTSFFLFTLLRHSRTCSVLTLLADNNLQKKKKKTILKFQKTICNKKKKQLWNFRKKIFFPEISDFFRNTILHDILCIRDIQRRWHTAMHSKY